MFANFHIIDLSHSLSSNIPTWDDSCGFQFNIGQENDEITISTSSGTHMDSPAHMLQLESAPTIDKIPLTSLLVSACVVDVSQRAHPDYTISIQDIREHEVNHGPIVENSLVIGYTGWSKHWPNSKEYRNVDSGGEMHFPVFSIESIEYLLSKNISGIAIDCFSPEPITNQTSFPIHKMLFQAKKYIIENIANAHLLPPNGFYMIALPLKIENSGEAPCRMIALVPR